MKCLFSLTRDAPFNKAIDIYFARMCFDGKKELEKEKSFDSMNNIPAGDGIKKRRDFYLNSFSVEFQREYFPLHT